MSGIWGLIASWDMTTAGRREAPPGRGVWAAADKPWSSVAPDCPTAASDECAGAPF
jgi:hypothetical protein